MASMYATLATSALKSTPHVGGCGARSAGFQGQQRLALRSAFVGEQVSCVSKVREERHARKTGDVCLPSASLDQYAPLTAAVYGACLLGGGLFAYTRTGSKGSLGGGITGGVALGVVPETRDLGEAIGFGVAVLFATIFAIRLVSTGKVVPAGPLLGLSAVTSVVFALAYLQTRVLLP